MFNKKTLSSAVAAATTRFSLGKMITVAGVAATAGGLSMSSMAQIDVSDADNPGKVAIASESVAPTTSGTLPVGVGDPGGLLNVTGQLATGVPNDDQIFMRFDWSSAALLDALDLSSLSVDGTDSSSLTGGLAGDNFAIFGVTADSNGFSQTAGFILDITGAGIALSGTSTDVRVRIYNEPDQANAGGATGLLSDQSVSGAVSLGEALKVSFASETATAEVTEDFLQFEDGVTGTLGSFTASANTTFVLADMLVPVMGLDDLVDTGTASVVTYTGDFSFATSGSNPYFVGTGTSCATFGAALTVDTAGGSQSATIDDVAAANGNALCVTVNGTDEVIPETTYEAEVVLVHTVTSSDPSVTDATGQVGVIDRNGTTVHVAYLTTFEDYNQRLILNSRHGADAEYNVTFKSEDGTTCTATDMATGVLESHQNLVMRVKDLVDITGDTTRCSGTVTVVAPEANIDVATTQVNLSDGGTDTVVYN